MVLSKTNSCILFGILERPPGRKLKRDKKLLIICIIQKIPCLPECTLPCGNVLDVDKTK